MNFIKSLKTTGVFTIVLATTLLGVNAAQSNTLYRVCTKDKDGRANIRQYATISSAVIDTVRNGEPFITTKIVAQDYKGNLWEFGFFKVFYNANRSSIDNLTTGWINRPLLCPVK
jgi:hypothetical protein